MTATFVSSFTAGFVTLLPLVTEEVKVGGVCVLASPSLMPVGEDRPRGPPFSRTVTGLLTVTGDGAIVMVGIAV